MNHVRSAKVLRLKRAGFTARASAKDIGASYAEVTKVLRSHGLGRQKKPKSEIDRVREDLKLMERPYVRCPLCGARVQLPCLECQITAQR